MIDEIVKELRDAIHKCHESFKNQLSRIRTGRAHPALLDSVRADYYGSPTPLSQMATIGVPEPRTLTVKPWDKSQIKIIEKAIMEADLGLNPQNDGDIIRVPMPQLTEERRKDLVKSAKKHAEECKVAIRKARHDSKDLVDALDDVSEDEKERAMKQVEEIVQQGVTQVDEMVARKEKDITEI